MAAGTAGAFDRTISRARATARATVVRRAAPPPDASAACRRMDRRQRGRAAVARAGHYPVALFPLADVGSDVLHRTAHDHAPGTRRRHLVHRARWRPVSGARGVAILGPARLRDRARRPGRLRLAIDGCVLRGGRAHLWPCRGPVSPGGHPAHVAAPGLKDGGRVVADTTRPLVLYQSDFAPRWYVPRADIDEAALTRAGGQTFCPYKGLADYFDVGERSGAAWSYLDAWPKPVPSPVSSRSSPTRSTSSSTVRRQLRAGADRHTARDRPRSRCGRGARNGSGHGLSARQMKASRSVCACGSANW